MINAANFHGSTGLITYLRALEMGPGELKRYVDAAIPRELGHYVLNKDESGYDLKPVRELITMEGIEGTLFRRLTWVAVPLSRSLRALQAVTLKRLRKPPKSLQQTRNTAPLT